MSLVSSLHLGNAELDASFPFHLAFDRDGRVIHAGPVLQRLIPELRQKPLFASCFRIVRPSVEPTFAAITGRSGELFLLESLAHPELTLRGQMLPISGAVVLFMGQPKVTEIGALVGLGLSVRDFAIHDAVVDFCFALQLQNTALAEASELASELALVNQELELRVQARTEELVEANRSMRLILETVGQGFVCVEPDGRLATERSAILERWFGPAPEAVTLWAYIAQVDPRAAESLRLGWEQVFDGFLPLELTISQLPLRVVANERVLDLEYRPIMDQERLVRVLVIASDGTDRVARERSEARQREMLRIFECLMMDKDNFVESFTEIQRLVELVIAPLDDAVTIKRHIHTLKGSAGFLGLASLASYCHKMEDRMAEAPGDGPSNIDISGLRALWALLLADIDGLLGSRPDGEIHIDNEEFNEILRVVQANGSHHEISAMIRSWKLEPVRLLLNRLGTKARALAQSLGKPDLEIIIESSNELRLDPARWRTFWSTLLHVIRNAVDHGIESPEERQASGKRANGRLTLGTSMEGGCFVIEVADDGRGIDWAGIAAKARQAGLPNQTAEALVNAVFADGVSTRDGVTENSGRGVGLAAVHSECLALGGQIQLDSTLGEKTRFRFMFPASTVGSVPSAARERKVQMDGRKYRRQVA